MCVCVSSVEIEPRIEKPDSELELTCVGSTSPPSSLLDLVTPHPAQRSELKVTRGV